MRALPRSQNAAPRPGASAGRGIAEPVHVARAPRARLAMAAVHPALGVVRVVGDVPVADVDHVKEPGPAPRSGACRCTRSGRDRAARCRAASPASSAGRLGAVVLVVVFATRRLRTASSPMNSRHSGSRKRSFCRHCVTRTKRAFGRSLSPGCGAGASPVCSLTSPSVRPGGAPCQAAATESPSSRAGGRTGRRPSSPPGRGSAGRASPRVRRELLAHHRVRGAPLEAQVDADLHPALEPVAVGEPLVPDAAEVLRLVPEDGDRAGRARERLHPVLERELVERVADPGHQVRPVAADEREAVGVLGEADVLAARVARTCARCPAILVASREKTASARAWFADETALQPCGRAA